MKKSAAAVAFLVGSSLWGMPSQEPPVTAAPPALHVLPTDRLENFPDIFRAVDGGDLESVRLIVERDTKAVSTVLHDEWQVINGVTPLWVAVECGQLEIAKFLLAHGALPSGKNARGETELMRAAEHRWDVAEKLTEILLAAGAKVDEQDSKGVTALMRTGKVGNTACFKRLLRARAASALRDDEFGRTAALFLVVGARHPRVVCSEVTGILDELVAKDGPETLRDRGGSNILHAAIESDRPELVRYAIAKVENLDQARGSPSAGAALHLAVQRLLVESDSLENIKILLDAGAHVDVRGSFLGQTPLMLAIEEGRYRAAELLVARGADIDARRTAGVTALIDCVEREDVDGVRWLIEHGAKNTPVNTGGSRASDIVRRWGDSIAGKRRQIADLMSRFAHGM